ncbi:MAG: GTP-binding protein [Pseudoclavibacter sp.]|nr:GTP-binding protein [Pseudoclavibacter sp.]
MEEIEVIAVTGACAPERRKYAERLASGMRRPLVTAARVAVARDAGQAAAELLGRLDAVGAVLEAPFELPGPELVGALAGPSAPTRLGGIVCVVDAAHLLQDLAREDYLIRPERGVDGRPDEEVPLEYTARALLTASQIEFASTLLLVGWQGLPTAELTLVMAVLSHLAPSAALRLGGAEGAGEPPAAHYGPGQDRPGWVRLLNGEFEPVMTDPRVRAFRYERMRPAHPQRLLELLDERVEPGEFGSLLRSAGFCRLATRPGVTAQWEQVGSMLSLEPLVTDRAVEREVLAGAEPLALGQDIAFIGVDLDEEALMEALDAALLDDREMADGPRVWREYADPFPSWSDAFDPAE